EYSVLEGDQAVKLPLPLSVDMQGEIDGQLIGTLRKAWTPENGPTIPQGALFAFPLREFLATRKMPHVAVLFAPDARSSIQRASAGENAVYASIFENVTGSIRAYKRDAATGGWSERRLALPTGGSTGVASTNDFGPEAYFTYNSFLTPPTMYSSKGE